MLTRRIFLRGSTIAMAGMGAVPGWLTRAASVEGKKRKTLVVIFQRGAADGLNIVIPFADKRYRDLRPILGIAAPTGPLNAGNSIDLDGQFALNGAMQPLKALWDSKQLAIVEATGSTDASRSHFEAQEFMESGTTSKSLGDGWLNRALPKPGDDASPLRAISMGNQVARTLRGERDAIAVGDAQQFNMGGNQSAASIMESMYATTTDKAIGRSGKDAFDAMKLIKSISQGQNTPRGGSQQLYGQGGELGRNLQQLARLIKADAGVEAAFAEINGWDHHSNENPQLNNLLRQFSSALAGFSLDMGDRMEDIVLVTMSEFGRTAAENGNGGTDHGHGSLMLTMGGPIQGGKVYGKWPGLEKEQLFEGRDLAVTTDYRTVLGEVIQGHLGQKDLSPIFPGFLLGQTLGLLKG
ncbi:MAG: DUF1501 domain-containing protein [Acidobacteriota bacterium]